MGVNKGIISKNKGKKHGETYSGALFASLVFVGIPIILCIVLLLVLYMDRV